MGGGDGGGGGRSTSESFQTGWVMSHLREVETTVGKPLLLEEFGKKLTAAEYANGSILARRDPIFQSMYTAVEGAINQWASPPPPAPLPAPPAPLLRLQGIGSRQSSVHASGSGFSATWRVITIISQAIVVMVSIMGHLRMMSDCFERHAAGAARSLCHEGRQPPFPVCP